MVHAAKHLLTHTMQSEVNAHLGGLLHVGGIELAGQGQLVHGLELGLVEAAGDALVVQAHLHQAAIVQPLLHSAPAAPRGKGLGLHQDIRP